MRSILIPVKNKLFINQVSADLLANILRTLFSIFTFFTFFGFVDILGILIMNNSPVEDIEAMNPKIPRGIVTVLMVALGMTRCF